jgi:hypothetical protein
MGEQAEFMAGPVARESLWQRFTYWRSEKRRLREELCAMRAELTSTREARDAALADARKARAEHQNFAEKLTSSQEEVARQLKEMAEAVAALSEPPSEEEVQSIQVGRAYLGYLRSGKKNVTKIFAKSMAEENPTNPAVCYVAKAVLKGDGARSERMEPLDAAFWKRLLEPFATKGAGQAEVA